MGALAKLRSLFHRKGWNGDPWAPISQPWNVWQMFPSAGRADAGSYGPVYACWAILAQEVSRIPLKHLVFDDDGAATPVYNRAPARVLRVPNAYQTRSDFLMYLMRSLLSEGNAYARVTRNNRFEISALYPLNPRQCRPYKDPQTGDIYYQLSTGDEKDPVWVPARDMLHIRLFTPTDPLIGETPLVAAALTVQAGTAINGQVASFFGNMARPSGIIRHPGTLQPDAIQRIKTRFKEASSNVNAGDPIVFTEGMEWESLTMSAVDAELIASARFSQTQIAQIYRVPPFMLGDMEQAKFASVEAMTRWFVNSGLGFYLDHISDSLTKLFELPAGRFALALRLRTLRCLGFGRQRDFEQGLAVLVVEEHRFRAVHCRRFGPQPLEDVQRRFEGRRHAGLDALDQVPADSDEFGVRGFGEQELAVAENQHLRWRECGGGVRLLEFRLVWPGLAVVGKARLNAGFLLFDDLANGFGDWLRHETPSRWNQVAESNGAGNPARPTCSA